MITNIALLLVQDSAKVELFGKVEALGYQWSTYTMLYKNEIETRTNYSPLNVGESHYKSMITKNIYSKSKGKDYIVVGKNEKFTARHNRVYYIDDMCSLFFNGQAKLSLKNVSLRCKY
ncbi:hypothetical protein [Vibrio harveyi]|uniref:hypothetical protein n=1 Tax=Vibrio harveyi TaxID=669 RepID=UPI000AFA5483|nr:hypothetical protein [Vibrio harveyi]